MTFHSYFYSLSAALRAEFADRCKTSVGYLNLIASGARQAGESLAMRIEEHSVRKVLVEEMRPDAPWHVVRSGASHRPPKKAVMAAEPRRKAA